MTGAFLFMPIKPKKSITKNKKVVKAFQKLRGRQQKFVESYVQSLNATQAAIDAGYGKKNARTQGSENLQHPNIQQAISEIVQYVLPDDLIKSTILQQCLEISKADVKDFFEYQDDKLKFKGFEHTSSHLIKRIAQRKDGSIAIELFDKIKAVEILAKYLKLYTDGLQLPEGSDVNFIFNLVKENEKEVKEV